MVQHASIDHTGITGAGSPTEILDIPTAETDDSLVLAPDGAGGVEFRAEAGGSSLVSARYIDSAHASYTTTGTSFADLDSASNLTITTGAHRVLLGCTLSAENSGSASTCFTFTVDGTAQGGAQGLTLTNLGPGSVAWTYLTDVLSAASHTFKIQWKVTANTGTVHMAAAGAALHFWAIEQAS